MIGLGLRDASFVGQADLRKGLAAAWRFEESSGTRNDSIGSAHLTESAGMINSASGKSGNGVDFVQADSRLLTVNDCPEIKVNSGFTIAFWVNFKSAVQSMIFAKGPITGAGSLMEYHFFTFVISASSVAAIVKIGSVGFNSGVTLATNQWHFCVAWSDGTQFAVRWNTQVTSPSQVMTASAVVPNSDPLTVGGPSFGATGYADCMLDELMIWNRILTRSEQATLYRAGAGRFLGVNF